MCAKHCHVLPAVPVPDAMMQLDLARSLACLICHLNFVSTNVLQNDLSLAFFVIRCVKKSPAERYGNPVMVPSSDSGAGSDACQNHGQGLGSASDEEDTFPPSYQPPLVGLMSKGTALRHTLLQTQTSSHTSSTCCPHWVATLCLVAVHPCLPLVTAKMLKPCLSTECCFGHADTAERHFFHPDSAYPWLYVIQFGLDHLTLTTSVNSLMLPWHFCCCHMNHLRVCQQTCNGRWMTSSQQQIFT